MATAEHYREQAARARTLALRTTVNSLRETMEGVARQYDKLAEKAEKKRL